MHELEQLRQRHPGDIQFLLIILGEEAAEEAEEQAEGWGSWNSSCMEMHSSCMELEIGHGDARRVPRYRQRRRDRQRSTQNIYGLAKAIVIVWILNEK